MVARLEGHGHLTVDVLEDVPVEVVEAERAGRSPIAHLVEVVQQRVHRAGPRSAGPADGMSDPHDRGTSVSPREMLLVDAALHAVHSAIGGTVTGQGSLTGDRSASGMFLRGRSTALLPSAQTGLPALVAYSESSRLMTGMKSASARGLRVMSYSPRSRT